MIGSLALVPSVELTVWSNGAHLQQLYAGLAALHRDGEIVLTQRVAKAPPNRIDGPPHLRSARHAHCSVTVDDRCTIYYDMHDGWEVDETALMQHDWYFKRSFYPGKISGIGGGIEKVQPYGLNYEVSADWFDLYALRRAFLEDNWRGFLRTAARASRLTKFLRFDSAIEKLEARVSGRDARNIIFMARAWEPSVDPDLDPELKDGDIDAERAADRSVINEMRAACIRGLRREFGKYFIGGLTPTRYALQMYPDVVISSEVYRKSNYLKLLRESAIAVATAGLQGSVGWKLAEYVAFSRAIVSERIEMTLPGGFRAGANYLPFSGAQECVEGVYKLFVDADLRQQMMTTNREYYLNHLHPKAVALRSLAVALGNAKPCVVG